MRAIMQTLSHLSVGNRLFLGFGLSCLFTLVVGISGGRAVGLMTESHARTRELALMQTLVLRVQVAQRDFAQARSAEAASNVRHLIGELGARLQQDSAQAGISPIEAALKSYAEEFEKFDRLQLDAQRARTSMQTQADEVRRTFEVIEQDFFDVAEGIGTDAPANVSRADAVTQANSVAELIRMLLALRTLEFAYDLQPGPENFEAWRTYTGGVTETLESLRRSVDGTHEAALQEAQAALRHYIEAFSSYRTGAERSATSQARMIELANRMQDLVASQYDLESQALDQDSRRFQAVVAVISLLSLLLGGLAAWVIRHLTLVPLRESLTRASRVAAGDLGEESMARRGDEFGTLQVAMGAMTASLRSLVGHIDTGVRRLAQATDALSKLSSGSLDESQRQRAEAEQTAGAMRQVTASARSVAEEGALASQAALDANTKARQGEQLVTRMIAQMHQLSAGMRQTAGSIAQLESESRGTVEVLGVIKTLAEQTNLLALNAAIEAARAGEQGRGFAVVADGVRGLAGRTRFSASEIETTIQSWLGLTARVVEEMNAGLAVGDTCVGLAEGAGRLLEEIRTEVAAIESRIGQIAAAAEQQCAAAVQVNESTERVRDMAESTVATSRKVDGATQDLVRLGEDLQQLTRQFRNVD